MSSCDDGGERRKRHASRGRGQQNGKNSDHAPPPRSKLLVLHGNRQTGQLLLGRMDKLRKKLLSSLQNVELTAIDAPFSHPEDATLRTWWNHRPRDNNTYEGLQESMELVQAVWINALDSDAPFTGLFGFSQGARLVHLLAVQHETLQQQQQQQMFLPGLQFVVMVAGYEAPLPDNFLDDARLRSGPAAVPAADLPVTEPAVLLISIPSLHVWGERDQLITPQQSEAVAKHHYNNAQIHVHDGGHHVPMRAADVRAYVDFVAKHSKAIRNERTQSLEATPEPTDAVSINHLLQQPINVRNNGTPDEETALQQREEVEALQAIYPDEFHLVSKCNMNGDGETIYEHPIQYLMDLVPTSDEGVWPPHPVSLHVTYPPTYPSSGGGDDGVFPILKLVHDNNGVQFTGTQTAACLQAMYAAAEAEQSMPCVMTCLLAARDYFESGAMTDVATAATATRHGETDESNDDEDVPSNAAPSSCVLKAASEQRIRDCNLQGLEIAEKMLIGSSSSSSSNAATSIGDVGGSTTATETPDGRDSDAASIAGKGGSWLFTIGLVGKPSAGKSTFFNTATGFARQRQSSTAVAADKTKQKKTDSEVDNVLLGGAAMAPHPFTTISPNTGFALVPAPFGSCPEEEDAGAAFSSVNTIGSTHGRDSEGRRLVPVVLWDVAGLVPGAYQGRGRGNQFLNDLCNADVLIHVCDASGTADSEGNIVVAEVDRQDAYSNDSGTNQGSTNSTTWKGALHPLQDMAWIRNELIEWVYTNLTTKWDIIRRKGRMKLAGMFSGYGQPQAMTLNILNAVEKYMEQMERRERALEHLDEWDAGDLHRLVSVFLGVRFPIALALNKMDLPSSEGHIRDIQAALPIHGTHVGTPLSARKEMMFARRYIEAILRGSPLAADEKNGGGGGESVVPRGTWNCLQSAISLCEPILVFPVVDHHTYAPLPGLFKFATSDPSLPRPGMIACLQAAGGSAPSEWDSGLSQYTVPKANRKKSATSATVALRDAIMMKPGSTVNGVFLTLKRMGAVGGEFVRAEAAGDIGVPAKPIPKYQVVTKKTRILKIMTNKRTVWQST